MALTTEDIMCDQQIISTDINLTVEHHDDLSVPERKLWLQNFIYSFRYHLVPALAALIANGVSKSLAPLQRIPSGVIRITFRQVSRPEPLAITDGSESAEEYTKEPFKVVEIPERCVECTVLHEPEEEACADVIFIHGLHGGLDRTWTQGTWRTKNPKFKNLTPIRRESTGNMYVRVKEDPQALKGRLKRTLTKIYTNIPVKVPRRNSNSHSESIKSEDEVDQVNITTEIETENRFEGMDEENFSRCWPKDWLPQDCPGARVLAINYTTDQLWRPLWKKMTNRTDLLQRSKEMMDELLRFGVGKRPIVWVGHSKGGLYIKQILLNASHENNETKNIFDHTKAIMFYSVPHKGSPVADMVFPFFKRSIEVLELQSNCEFVLNLHKRFLEMFENSTKPEIFSFIDTENTPVGFTSLKFIAYESADPDIGIKCDVPLNHREICKPAGRDCFLYLELVKLINRVVFCKEK